MTRHEPHRRYEGFSTVELLVVVAIIVTVAAISIPTVSKVLTSARLRGGMGDLSGLFQNARNMSVRQNAIARVRFQSSNNRWVAFVDNGVNPTGLTQSTPQVWLPPQFSKVNPPSGGGGEPTALDNTTCGTTSSSPPDTADDTYFNQMGIPCQYSGTCSNSLQAFAYYFNYLETANSRSWAALCVSPAGRIKAWYWTGSSWTN